MAEGMYGKNLIDLERDITCSVCQEHYTEPKILPCLHYFCKKCILQLALRKAINKPFSCPECRKETSLPEGGVEELKTAFFVYRMKDMYFTVERVHSKIEVMCEECKESGGTAEAFCRECAKFICQECVKSHKRMQLFCSHELSSLEDLKKGQARKIAVKEPPTKKCEIHEEPLIIYCFDCNSLICRDCTTKIHRDHNFEFSKVAAPSTKKDLLEMLQPLKETAINLSESVREIKTTKHEVEAQGDLVANTIETSFKELEQILTKRKKELLSAACRKVQGKINKLSAQEKSLSLASGEVHSIINYTESFVSCCSDSEVMNMHTEIRSQIQRQIEEHRKSGRRTEPVEEADMGVEIRCLENISQRCRTKANITQLAVDPVKCILAGEGLEAEVNKTAEVTLSTRFTNNKTTRRSVVVVGQLKSLYNGSVIKCDVNKSGSGGEYRIQYTPTVRGRHKLTVSVNGQQLAGSPFPVFVSIHPTLLGKPVKMWKNVSRATGITTNTAGDVIVTERYNNILKLKANGKTSVLIKHSDSQLSYLNSISTSKDNIYCTDSFSKKIMKCNLRGNNIQVLSVNQGQEQGHWDIAVVRNKVLLCECGSKGTVRIYDRDLKHVRSIGHKGELRGLSADLHGNIYVTDTTNECVHVFTNEGVFLRSFGGGRNLKSPHYICVSGHYVYISNCDGHNVSVFTTAGEYVTSFGQYGGGEGDLSCPCGVCTDRDGFLYVADYGNNRVQCF